jgi:hypothetical protein
LAAESASATRIAAAIVAARHSEKENTPAIAGVSFMHEVC